MTMSHNNSNNNDQNNIDKLGNVKIQDMLCPDVVTVASCVPSDGTTRWDVFWAEARLLPGVPVTVNPSTTSGMNESHRDDDDTAVVIAVEVEDVPPPSSTTQKKTDGSVVVADAEHDTTSTGNISSRVSNFAGEEGSNGTSFHYNPFHFFGLLFGMPFVIAAFVTTFGFELVGMILYYHAIFFYGMAHPFEQKFYLFYAVFMLVSYIFIGVDFISLLIDIIVTELYAGTAYYLTGLFGGCTSTIGSLWYHYIRRVCHLLRWTFRGMHSDDVKPARGIPMLSHQYATTTTTPTTAPTTMTTTPTYM